MNEYANQAIKLSAIIKLSARQLEGSRFQAAVSRIKCAVCAAAVCGLSVQSVRNRGDSSAAIFAALAAVFLAAAVYYRSRMNYELWRTSEEYLGGKCSGSFPVQLLGLEVLTLAVKCAVCAAFALPSAICLNIGVRAYDMSCRREALFLMMGAALFLLMAGVIFAAIVNSLPDAAEYLLLSGECLSPFVALNESFRIMSGCCGETLALKFRLIFRLGAVAPLSAMNFAARRAEQLKSAEIYAAECTEYYNFRAFADESSVKNARLTYREVF